VIVPLETPFEPSAIPSRPPVPMVSLLDTPLEEIEFPLRPSYCKTGKPVKLSCNHYSTDFNKNAVIYQYDFSLEGIEKMDLPSRRLTSIMNRLIEQNKNHLGNGNVAFDGRSILFASPELAIGKEAILQVIDSDNIAPPQKGRREPQKFSAKLTLTATRKLIDVDNYLKGSKKEYPGDCITALDVVLRCIPSQKLSMAGRNFYTPSSDRQISGGAEVWTGFYQSLRIGQAGLTFNTDLAVSAFMRSMPLMDYICEQMKFRNAQEIERANIRNLEKVVKNITVNVTHRETKKSFKIAAISREPVSQLRIPKEDGSEGETIAEYFGKKYFRLRYPNLPCIRIGPAAKNMYLPLEVCNMVGGQRIMKLSEDQTAEIIRVACRRPDVRRGLVHKQIEEVVAPMNTHAHSFGIKIKPTAISMTGRVLNPPQMRYGSNCPKPLEVPSNGKWNFFNKKFFEGGALKCWAVVSFCSERDFSRGQAENFVTSFVNTAKDHGMTTPMEKPPIMLSSEFQGSPKDLMKEALLRASKQCGNIRPQFILCIKNGKEIQDYAQIKIASDTSIGVPSQCMILKHARECKVQVIANILLKVNAKLGGKNTVTDRPLSSAPTIVLGGDVHHPGPGSDRPSIAAVVASLDRHFARHAATVRVQEKRKEVIEDLQSMVRELLVLFYNSSRIKPVHILFLRDGVSEGEFRQVLQYEVKAIEAACRSLDANFRPKITFITCQKRHHTRIFAVDKQDMDNSGNIPAGTVVDTAICHPREFDFFMCSHSGIQGTSRPTKYTVLWDEYGFKPDDLQKMMFEMCFMQTRCTRSVSVPPAVYYAHLVAFRAQHFVKEDSDIESSVSGKSGGGGLLNINWQDKFDAVHKDLKDVMYFI